MVFQYANNGSLSKFLMENFRNLTWQTKLKILLDISLNLYEIHLAGYIHNDLHSGNILLDQRIGENMQSYISDLGLSKKLDEMMSSGEVYGVMPYIAPELMLGDRSTQASDIYSFGIIMTEMSTGKRPFAGNAFNSKLALKICSGLRPEFSVDAPDCYIELARQCTDSNPKKRPNALNIWNVLGQWNESIKGTKVDEIKKQFLNADKISNELPISLPKHPDTMYTSKLINTQPIIGLNTKNLLKEITSEMSLKEFVIEGFDYLKDSALQFVAIEGSKYTLKCLNDNLEKIKNEIKIIMKLNHPNIIKLYGVSNLQDTNFLVLQFVNGGDLRKYLQSKLSEGIFKIKFSEIYKFARQISKGLQYLHEKGIIHRDLHSKNILINDNKILITGFNMSMQTDEDTSETSIVPVMPAYSEPQCILQNTKKYNEKSDIYSLGVIFWELTSGAHPFRNLSDVEIILKITKDEREDVIPGTPPSYSDLYKNVCQLIRINVHH
ncbi:kinase-like domain-containing protein [Gigaspora rosea]|uniref:Kinase-like domain-containing protein n=1 Tax=Gigaspora rosea TaxID=44941 RepID=A0A397UZ75_9GLOM|nr:kinase-like domain-containing protein [Gigaspora rosea]